MNHKRIISILLVLTLCLSLMSGLALAEEEPVTEAPAQEDTLPAEAEAPAEEAEAAGAPAEAAEEPAAEAEAPAEAAEEPAEEAGEPAEAVEEPAEESEEPVEESEEPVEASEEPTEEDGAAIVDIHSDIHSFSGSFTFPSTFNQKNVTAQCSYNDAMFSAASSTYNHDLAKMSLSMSLASYNSLNDHDLFRAPNGLDQYVNDADSLGSTPADSVVKLMKDCGFTNIALNRDYLISTEYNATFNKGNNIGVCIGAKALEDGTTLIAVAIRSGRYGDEWIGNFNLYNDENSLHHIGFNTAANSVFSAIRAYVTRKGISGSTKIWLSGYSRGAAVANLTASRLCGGVTWLRDLTPADVYAYTFESPLTTKDTNAGAAVYNGIWNIVNPTDVMSQVPPAAWGYTRYGNNLYLPAANFDAGTYGAYADAALADYNKLRGESNSDLVEVPLQAYAGRRLFDAVTEAEGGATDAGGLAGALQSTMRQHFREHEYSTNTEFSDVVMRLPEQLRGYVKDAGIKGSDYVLDNFSDVIVSHYPESTLAWMDSIPASALAEDAVSRYLKVDGASDYEIYNDEGVLQATVSGGKVTMQKDAVIQAIVDTDGKVVISVPQDQEARIRAMADKAGTVNVTATEFSLGDNAFGAPAAEKKTVKAGEVFQVNVSENSTGSDCSIVTPVEGDLNADGKADMNDAAVILRHAVGIGFAKLAGSLTVSDAAAILKG